MFFFFIFPDMFSREKTLSVLSHGLLPVPNVKSSSLYRTTNTTMLVKQNKKEKEEEKKKKKKRKQNPPCERWLLCWKQESAGAHAGSDPDTRACRVK